MIHKEDKRRFALEKNKKSFNITSSFSSHSFLFVQFVLTRNKFHAYVKDIYFHKEDKRRCALEEITSNLLFSLIVFSFCSLCAICFNAK